MAETNDKQKDWAAWAGALACPVCHGVLQREETRVVCVACGRAYPVEDGIAVLIAERGMERD
ncbi:MAG TPA: Trm112 family protein [Terracidiphilus sp.]|nr:Trm112 family protein [Terracidiphilus sp.]